MASAQKHYFTADVSVLRVQGEKTAVYLHSQLSNSIKDLAPGTGNYNLLLTNKGKVQADLFVLNRGAYFDLLVASSLVSRVDEHLSKLAPLSRVMLSRVPSLKALHVLGALPASWPKLERDRTAEVPRPDHPWLIYRSDRLGEAGCDVILESEGVGRCEEFLLQNGFARIGPDEVELIRLKNGAPKVGADVTEENLPQEGRLDRALHFSKGCYLGQEVIARLHFRGHVNKILAAFFCEGRPTEEEIRNAQGTVVGRVTSRAEDQGGKTYLLAYVPAKAFEAGETFTLGGSPLARLT